MNRRLFASAIAGLTFRPTPSSKLIPGQLMKSAVLSNLSNLPIFNFLSSEHYIINPHSSFTIFVSHDEVK